MHDYDKSSKWLIDHHGDSILRLAGVANVQSCRAIQPELVQPRRFPDGLLEATFEGGSETDLFLVEVATRPEPRLIDQMTDGLMLVYLDRGILPEAVALILRPKGRAGAVRKRELQSRRGLSRCSLQWRVVKLWELPAEELLKTNDAGLVPWVPLTKISGRPEGVFHRCREIIEESGPPDESENLLAVTQVLASLRYNKETLFKILGGREHMIESPLLEEIVSEAKAGARRETQQSDIISALAVRFVQPDDDLTSRIKSIQDEEELKRLFRVAVRCPNLEAFVKELND